MRSRMFIKARRILVVVATLSAQSCILPEVSILDNQAGGGGPNLNTGGTPSMSCDPVYPTDPTPPLSGCAGGMSCHLDYNGGATCDSAGPQMFEGTCQSDWDCGEGMFCDYDYGNICNYWCYTVADCPDFSTNCYQYETVESRTIGVCEW